MSARKVAAQFVSKNLGGDVRTGLCSFLRSRKTNLNSKLRNTPSFGSVICPSSVVSKSFGRTSDRSSSKYVAAPVTKRPKESELCSFYMGRTFPTAWSPLVVYLNNQKVRIQKRKGFQMATDLLTFEIDGILDGESSPFSLSFPLPLALLFCLLPPHFQLKTVLKNSPKKQS